MNIDRRDIAPLLRPHFPSMPEDASSDDWHGFLNAYTGLNIEITEENPSAFDKWRQALSEKGFPVWGITPAQAQVIVARGTELLAAEQKRQADSAALLATLALEAPLVTAQQLMDQAKP